MLIAARNGMMAGKRLPYDAEVEYLESTGTQWIGTGISMNAATDSFDTSIYVPSTTSAWTTLIGAQQYIGGEVYYQLVGTMGPTSGLRWAYPSLTASDAARDAWLEVHIESGNCTIAGVHFTDAITTSLSVPFALFGRASTSSEAYTAACRIAKFIFFRSGEKICDLIPVRIGSVGAMYDRRGVGGMNSDGSARTDGLYFNRGTGDFTLGPDI